MSGERDQDPEIERALAGRPVPEHRPGFWDDVASSMGSEATSATRRPRWVPVLAAAAALVVVAGLGVLLLRVLDDGDGSTELEVTTQTTLDGEPDPTPPVPTSTVPSTADATTIPATSTTVPVERSPIVGGRSLGEGNVAGVSRDATIVWVLAPDPGSDAVGCEGMAAEVLWAADAAGGRVRAVDDPTIAGRVVVGPDSKVAVVARCEGVFGGLWVGTHAADGTLDVGEVALPQDVGVLADTVRISADGTVTAVVAPPGPAAGLVSIDEVTGDLEVIADGDVLDGFVLADGTVVTATSDAVSIGAAVVDAEGEGIPLIEASAGDRVLVVDERVFLRSADSAIVGPVVSANAERYIDAAISPSGRFTATLTGGTERTPALWVLRDGAPLGRRAPTEVTSGIHVTDAGVVVAATTDGEIVTVELERGEGLPDLATTTVLAPTTEPGCGGGERDIGPRPSAGQELVVVGVAPDDELDVRDAPGTACDVFGTLAHDGTAIATGEAAVLADGQRWYQIEGGAADDGWVRAADVSVAGATDDATDEVVAAADGEVPEAGTMEAMAELVGRLIGTGTTATTVAGPTLADVGEITVDLLGADGAREGERLHVVAAPSASGEGFVLVAVERTVLCVAGVDAAGACAW